MTFKKNNIERKVNEYLELATIQPAPQRFFALRRELTARGLNPQRPRDLIQEARIVDNKTLVRQYIKLAEECELLDANDPRRERGRRAEKLAHQRDSLKDAGIDSLDPRILKRTLRSIKERAKLAERQRNPRYQKIHSEEPAPLNDLFADEWTTEL